MTKNSKSFKRNPLIGQVFKNFQKISEMKITLLAASFLKKSKIFKKFFRNPLIGQKNFKKIKKFQKKIRQEEPANRAKKIITKNPKFSKISNSQNHAS